jgi:peptide/nickel transport system permease protein
MSQTEQSASLPLGYGYYLPERSFGRTVRKLAAIGKRNKLGTVGVVLVIFILLVALFAPLIKRYDEYRQFRTENPNYNPLASPIDIAKDPTISTPFTNDRWVSPLNSKHWLGTDQYGRDIYARIVVGARLAVIIGIGSSLIAVGAGTVTGLISGYFSGKLDLLLQRLIDAVQAFPGLVLLLLLVSVMETPNLWLTVAALGFLGWAASTRIVRSAVLSVSASTYVEAARSYGATDRRIMVQHVLPNIVAPILVIFSISISLYILAEANLSFLGLGPADKTTWGKMVQSGRFALDLHPWESVIAGSAIMLAVLGFNLAGDALRDELDPRLRGR